MIPESIRSEHIQAAIDYVRQNGIPSSRQSKDFDLIVDGHRYPPKYIVACAAKYAINRLLKSEEFGGGKETNTFLEKLGFTVVAKSEDTPQLLRVAATVCAGAGIRTSSPAV